MTAPDAVPDGTTVEQLAAALRAYHDMQPERAAVSGDFGVAAASCDLHNRLVIEDAVSQWAHRGTLDKPPDEGITRASVLVRLGAEPFPVGTVAASVTSPRSRWWPS